MNKQKLLPVLKYFGFDSDEINEIEQLDFTKHLVFSIGENSEKMDFLTYISLVNFDEADKQKIIADIDGL